MIVKVLVASLSAFAAVSTQAMAQDCLANQSLATLEKTACLAEQSETLETAMVDAYKHAQVQNAVNDAPWVERLNSSLQQSQIDFETFRDSQCAFEATQQIGGTGTGLANLACRNALTQDRINSLTVYAGNN